MSYKIEIILRKVMLTRTRTLLLGYPLIKLAEKGGEGLTIIIYSNSEKIE